MPGKKWSKEEIELLKQKVLSGIKFPDLTVPNRTYAAINQKRQRLREEVLFNKVFPKRIGRIWTIAEYRRLQNLTSNHHLSAGQLARDNHFPGRTKDSISQMMRRNGLGNPKVSQSAKKAARISKKRRIKLEAYLKGPGRFDSSHNVSVKFGITEKSVNYYRRKWNVPLTWQEARSSDSYLEKRRRVSYRTSESNKKRWSKWRINRRKNLRALEHRMGLSGRHSNRTRKCKKCGEYWLKSNNFFTVTKRSRRGKVGYTMALVCRACKAEAKIV